MKNKKQKLAQTGTKTTLNREFLLKIMTVIVISLAAFENIAVTTAMPYVVDTLNGNNLYALAVGIGLATSIITVAFAGPWCDAKGPKPVLYIGALLLILGLLTATVAPSVEILVVGRAIQGLGTGLVVVPMYVIVSLYVEPKNQPSFFAAFAAAWVLPSLIGPVISGALVQYVHWRWVFGITPLLLILVSPFTIMTLEKFPSISKPSKIDNTFRIITLAFICGIVITALQIISGAEAKNFNLYIYLGTIALTIISLLAIKPLLPKGTFIGKIGLPATVLYRALIFGGYISTEIFLPFMLKNVHNYAPTKAGFVLTIGAVTWAVGSWVQSKVSNPERRNRLPRLGTLLLIAGMLVTLLGTVPNFPGELVFGGWLFASYGMGLLMPAITIHALAITPKEQHGQTSSDLQLADTLGAAYLVAYAGIIYALTKGIGDAAFTLTLGLMLIVVFIALWLTRRLGAPTT